MRPKLKLALVTLAVAAVAPAAALAEHPVQDQQSPAQTCKQLRTSMGVTAFNQAFGTNANRSNAFGKCVSRIARAQHENESEAARACRAEQNDPNFAATHGGKTFEQFYGTGPKGRNAFGKCVSAKSRAANAEERENLESAARACKAERRTLGEQAFRQKYGTNKTKSNAFGKCVSEKAKELEEQDD